MPSLRKRVSSYFRQLSFHNEPRDRRHNINENSFVTKYLQGHISLKEGPPIIYGKTPTDLPNYELGEYETGSTSISGCYSGPKGGLTTVKRTEKHLSVPDPDIDYIDTQDENVVPAAKNSPKRPKGQPVDNTTMVIKVAGQEYCVTNRTKKRHSKSHSLGSISNFNLEIETTKIDKDFYTNTNNNTTEVCFKNNVQPNESSDENVNNSETEQQSYSLSKSKSEGNPFQHKKRGKIIKLAQRPNTSREDDTNGSSSTADDISLPAEWNKKSDLIYGISDSLYDHNQITNCKNGDPIADCFGIISRTNSAIVAVADGVNWGEKASIAAKSAVHGCLHYLNKTIFNDSKPFDNLTIKTDEGSAASATVTNRVANTREIFVCLLRAFSCAHDLILENNGMLTTLTVAVVLPLKRRDETQRYVCCVCNVGDTLAYVYSQRHGLRELTKGSHDINCNRDMRDALGALGPVDGINPELSNLTLSITTLNKGDIVMVASDGLTDNFDPNVCRFTVNHKLTEAPTRIRRTPSTSEARSSEPPVKPPRRSQIKGQTRSSVKSSASSVQVAENKTSSLRKQISSQQKQSTASSSTAKSDTVQGYKFLRSKTTIEVRSGTAGYARHIARNEDGIPYVTPIQRYELQLLLIEDVLKNGISGNDQPCTTAKKLCENLVSFTFSITAAKRRTLEDQDLYFDNRNGVLVEVSQQEKKLRRKKGLEKVQILPGKLDHVTVVAWNVGQFTCQ